MSDSNYWAALDQLLADLEIVIDRPKNSAHPRYPEWIYPLDYGYLQNTSSMDGEGLDGWVLIPRGESRQFSARSISSSEIQKSSC